MLFASLVTNAVMLVSFLNVIYKQRKYSYIEINSAHVLAFLLEENLILN